MNVIDLIMLLSFGAPFFISLISVGMMAAQSRNKGNKTERKLLNLTLGYFLCMAVSSLTVIFFVYDYNLYIYSSSFSFLSLVLSVVFFYHIIYVLTSDNPLSNPSVIHYAIPILLTIIHFGWSLLVPYSVQYDIVAYRTLDWENYKWFCIYYTSKLWVYAAYNVVYSILIFRRMPSYRNYVQNYSADEDKSSLHWIYTIIFLCLIIIPISYTTFLLQGEIRYIHKLLAIFVNILYIIEIVIMQYNMFMRNYVIIYEENCSNNTRPVNINKEKFEKYMEEQKPYLNPSLKITDITYEFNTCRSYLSSFINSTYGMNFSRYINSLRIQEFEKLKRDQANKNYSNAELAIKAGFNYRSYIRFRKTI